MRLKTLAELCDSVYDNGRRIGQHQIQTHVLPDGTLAIAIAGTNDKKDVITDLKIWSTHGIHAGFWESYCMLQDLLKSLRRPGQKVIWTGHSMGGAIAQIAAANLGGSAVTFGSPRVFTRWTSPPLDHIRVTASTDPVPGLLPIFYHHLHTQHIQLSTTDHPLDGHLIDTYIAKLNDYK